MIILNLKLHPRHFGWLNHVKSPFRDMSGLLETPSIHWLKIKKPLGPVTFTFAGGFDMEDEFDMDLGGDDDEAHCDIWVNPTNFTRNSLWMVVYAWAISSRISSPKKATFFCG